MNIAAAATATPLDQILPYAPIVIAIIGVVSVFVGAKVLKPASYSETWAELRNLRHDLEAKETENETIRTDMRALRDDLALLRTQCRLDAEVVAETHAKERKEDRRRLALLGDGFVALNAYINVLSAAITAAGQPVPPLSSTVQDTIDAARAVALEP